LPKLVKKLLPVSFVTRSILMITCLLNRISIGCLQIEQKARQAAVAYALFAGGTIYMYTFGDNHRLTGNGMPGHCNSIDSLDRAYRWAELIAGLSLSLG
jgi:hypothetical protein